MVNWRYGYIVFVVLLLTACDEKLDSSTTVEVPGERVDSLDVHPIALNHAKTFSIVKRGDFWVVDLRASVAAWGGKATGPEQRARVVLVPKNTPPPAMAGEFSDAQIIDIPVDRIAVNLAPFEAMLTALDEDKRLVAVGGPKSYNDAVRQRVLDGELAQIGYGWHMPPILDALLGAEPDVLLMAMGDLTHRTQMERIRALGTPVFPLFINSEPHYMGKVEYIRLIGLLTGKSDQAEAFVKRIEARVAELKAQAFTQPTKRVISAWYSGSGRWMAAVRNSEAAFLRDANGKNLLEEADDPLQDDFQKFSTEQILIRGADAECAILRDSHSQVYRDKKTLMQFRAYRNGCVFAIDGSVNTAVDAYDYYERAVIRPDLILEDVVRMLHPVLRNDQPFNYIQPDKQLYE